MKTEIIYLIFLYDILFPALAALYSEYILMQRPAAFTPRQIPDSHPDLADIKQKKRFALTLSVLVFCLIAPLGYLLLRLGNPGGIVATEPLG